MGTTSRERSGGAADAGLADRCAEQREHQGLSEDFQVIRVLKDLGMVDEAVKLALKI